MNANSIGRFVATLHRSHRHGHDARLTAQNAPTWQQSVLLVDVVAKRSPQCTKEKELAAIVAHKLSSKRGFWIVTSIRTQLAHTN